MFRIHFVSLNRIWIDEIQKRFGENPLIQFTCGKLETLPVFDNHVFLSPANSFGQMTGGIDYTLSRVIFPGCEAHVRNRLQLCPTKTILGRSYLDIGSALYIPLPTYRSALIVSPTMFFPEDVSTTMNAYISFLAALLLMKKVHVSDESVLVATSHCCGFGCMDPAESARQMYDAYMDFTQNRINEHTESVSAPDFVKLAIPETLAME